MEIANPLENPPHGRVSLGSITFLPPRQEVSSVSVEFRHAHVHELPEFGALDAPVLAVVLDLPPKRAVFLRVALVVHQHEPPVTIQVRHAHVHEVVPAVALQAKVLAVVVRVHVEDHGVVVVARLPPQDVLFLRGQGWDADVEVLAFKLVFDAVLAWCENTWERVFRNFFDHVLWYHLFLLLLGLLLLWLLLYLLLLNRHLLLLPHVHRWIVRRHIDWEPLANQVDMTRRLTLILDFEPIIQTVWSTEG